MQGLKKKEAKHIISCYQLALGLLTTTNGKQNQNLSLALTERESGQLHVLRTLNVTGSNMPWVCGFTGNSALCQNTRSPRPAPIGSAVVRRSSGENKACTSQSEQSKNVAALPTPHLRLK